MFIDSEKGRRMKLGEVFEKIGRDKLKEAMEYDTKLGFSCFSDEYYEELIKKYANQHN